MMCEKGGIIEERRVGGDVVDERSVRVMDVRLVRETEGLPDDDRDEGGSAHVPARKEGEVPSESRRVGFSASFSLLRLPFFSDVLVNSPNHFSPEEVVRVEQRACLLHRPEPEGEPDASTDPWRSMSASSKILMV